MYSFGPYSDLDVARRCRCRCVLIDLRSGDFGEFLGPYQEVWRCAQSDPVNTTGNRHNSSGVYSNVNPFVAVVGASLMIASAALSQTTPLPCEFHGRLLRAETGKLSTFSSSEMKARARHKVDLSGLIRNADIKGTAKIDLLIGTSGEVVCLKVAPTHPLIKTSVERAVTAWQFKPALENGKPVAYLGRLEFFLCNILCGGDTTGMTLLK